MKKTYLLDTNIVSEFTKERPDEQVIDFYNARRELCAISSITWQEIVRGISRMPEGKRKNNLKSFLKEFTSRNQSIISSLADPMKDGYWFTIALFEFFLFY